MTLQLRSLEQFKRLHDLQSSTVLVEEEHEFFGSLQSIRDRIVSSSDQWTLISHCEDQVNGFKHLDQIPVDYLYCLLECPFPLKLVFDLVTQNVY